MSTPSGACISFDWQFGDDIAERPQKERAGNSYLIIILVALTIHSRVGDLNLTVPASCRQVAILCLPRVIDTSSVERLLSDFARTRVRNDLDYRTDYETHRMMRRISVSLDASKGDIRIRHSRFALVRRSCLWMRVHHSNSVCAPHTNGTGAFFPWELLSALVSLRLPSAGPFYFPASAE